MEAEGETKWAKTMDETGKKQTALRGATLSLKLVCSLTCQV